MALPPCGVYRTSVALGEVPPDRLVYFHNHGDPGPGLYTPHAWALNRVQWHTRGLTLSEAQAATLEPLAPEGLYRVREAFFCCEKQCRRFEPETLVQLGYDERAQALLFVPEWTPSGLAFPQTGSGVAQSVVGRLVRLAIPDASPPAPGGLIH
jgi:hypothetical protein